MILAVSKRWHLWRYRLAAWALARMVRPMWRKLDAIVRSDMAAANEQNDKARLRFEVCTRCPLLTKRAFCSRELGGCGCYMPAKVQKPDAKCPQGRW